MNEKLPNKLSKPLSNKVPKEKNKRIVEAGYQSFTGDRPTPQNVLTLSDSELEEIQKEANQKQAEEAEVINTNMRVVSTSSLDSKKDNNEAIIIAVLIGLVLLVAIIATLNRKGSVAGGVVAGANFMTRIASIAGV